MDIMGDGVAGGGGGGITSFGLFAIEDVTGGAGLWNLTPTLPTFEADLAAVAVETLATDASADGSFLLVFQATSTLGSLNWSLDLTQFISPTTFGPPEEWGVSIDSSDSASPGECRVLLTMASTDAFEEGLKFGLLVDDGVNSPQAIYITLNHTETP